MKQALLYVLKVWAYTIVFVLIMSRQLIIMKNHSGAMSYERSFELAKQALKFSTPFYLAFLAFVLVIERVDQSAKSSRVLRLVCALFLYNIACWIIIVLLDLNPYSGEYWLFPEMALIIGMYVWRLSIKPKSLDPGKTDNLLPVKG